MVKFSRNGSERRSTTCVWRSITWNCHSTTYSCRSITWRCHSITRIVFIFFGQLIFRKIITIVATRGQILRLKCTKFYFSRGSAKNPLLWRSLQRSPRPLAKRREGTERDGRGRKGKDREGRWWKEKGREGRGGGVGRAGNVEFHHLLLSNLTTAIIPLFSLHFTTYVFVIFVHCLFQLYPYACMLWNQWHTLFRISLLWALYILPRFFTYYFVVSLMHISLLLYTTVSVMRFLRWVCSAA